MKKSKIISYPQADYIHDEEGCLTQEALNYIKNWAWVDVDGEICFGQYFYESDFTNLLVHINSIWQYDDCVREEDGLLELHTMGWSDNEAIISELKNTFFWKVCYRASAVGGHYYFRLDRDSKKDWFVLKQ